MTDISENKVNVTAIMVAIAAVLGGFVCAVTGASLPQRDNPSMKRDRFLLLDDRVVGQTKNARLAVGKVQKSKYNPLFSEDKSWEVRFDNLYANVIYDRQEKLYECWYSPFIIDQADQKPPIEKRSEVPYRPKNREMGICYATSEDGLRWMKPKLRLVKFNGNNLNNLVVRGPHGAGIFVDLHDPDPKRRYKMFFKGSEISVAFSHDGLKWSKAIKCPEIDARGDTHNNALWAPTLGEYVGFTRTWAPPRGRQVARTSSKDFLNWSKAKVVLEGLENHLQTYAMPVFYYAGVYIGLPAIYNSKIDRTHTELAWSSDTIRWHRIDPGNPLIANSPKKGQYDWGCVYAAACPVFEKDEIRLYYGCSDDKHFGWRNGYFCLATLRPDGFAGYEQVSKNTSAFVVTKPLLYTGGTLCLSADIYGQGFVRTRILNDNDEELAEAKPARQSVTDIKVEWQNELAIQALKGKMVRLEFELKNAKLYSFSFYRPK